MNLVKSTLVVTASKELDEEVKKDMAAQEVSIAKLLQKGKDESPSGDDGTASNEDNQ